MLVLQRHVNEVIHIGPDIRVRIVSIHGNKVKVGIDAPADMTIIREELIDERQQEWTPRITKG